jgi:hypothetical protein
MQSPALPVEREDAFGKTFTAYQLAKKLGRTVAGRDLQARREDAWQTDLRIAHGIFDGWKYLPAIPVSIRRKINAKQPMVYFVRSRSLGRHATGNIKPKNE